MSDEELDPEVRADLELREQTTRDRTRSRSTRIYDWRPPVFVENWPCSVPNCDGEYPVESDAVERLEIFNAQLMRKGERPITKSEIGYCESCRAEYKRTAPERRRAQVDRMADGIRKLKAAANPQLEYTLLRQLEQWGHPDVKGLVEAIRLSREKPGSKRVRSGDV